MDGNIPRVSRFILDVVEKQLNEATPPQTRETLERLMGQGFSEEDARHLIGTAVVAEMRSVVSECRSFSEERFLALLQDLPRISSQ
ncbi:MAG: hypothetical protein EG824_02690 [Deltaproteobacteria bacterium]|nr:hypothetical protein [Deltaproteobacteria bacterium]